MIHPNDWLLSTSRVSQIAAQIGVSRRKRTRAEQSEVA